MAKEIGNYFNGSECCYRTGGRVTIRGENRLRGKKLKAGHIRLRGRASRIAAMVYRSLPVAFREYWMLSAFAAEALHWLRQGRSYDETADILWHTYASVWAEKESVSPLRTKKRVMAWAFLPRSAKRG